MEKIRKISHDFINSRIDKWIKKNVCNVPQNLIEKNLRNKNITVDKFKVKSSYRLRANDKIHLKNFNPQSHKLNIKSKYIPGKKEIKNSEYFIIDDNENFCVINKPFGLPVQGGTGIKKNLVDLISKNSVFLNSKPYIVHRIDKETSGILIIAKNLKYAQLFTSLFRIRRIHKSYLCISYGEMNKTKGVIDNDVVRYEKDKKIYEKAITRYKILDKNSNSSLLLLNPITGRKHQIRKHLSSMGHPVIGDTKYNFLKHKKIKEKYLMLHSYNIKFMINEKKYEFKVDTPDYFKKMLKVKRLTLSENF